MTMQKPGAPADRTQVQALVLPALVLPALVLLVLASFFVISGCRDRSDRGAWQDPRNPQSAVTCEMRCEWKPEGLIANLTFKNVSESEVSVLNRNLLIGDDATELTWSPFEVAHRGARIPYRGKLATPTPPTSADYRVLTPGEVVEATVNVSNAYDLSAPGAYRIRYASVNLSADAKKRIDIASNVIQITKP
jgi:hypothetical protein